MKKIPKTENSLVLRTDFSNEVAWKSICAAIEKPDPVDGFQAYVEFLSDPEYDGLTVEQLLTLDPQGSDHYFLFLVDQLALLHPEQPIVVVDLNREPGRTFRVIPSQMWAVQNNLSIANMDFEEFANSVDQDGIFRDFPNI